MDAFEARLQQEKLAALKEFAYGASHEINNPLASIHTLAQVLARDEQHVERRRMLTSISVQAMRAHEMISDLMLFASPPALDLQQHDVGDLVRKAIDACQPYADDASANVKTTLPEELMSADVDATQIVVAVSAVIRNALEAIDSGGRVDVSLSESEIDDAPAVIIIVQDNGPGLNERERCHAFDPFFSGREAGRGLGFGLCKCWRIIDQHGGEVHIDSTQGRGTTVRMMIPVAAASRAAAGSGMQRGPA